MHPGQVDMLKYLVNLERPSVPFYVCTIQGASTVEGKSKMVSNDYISRLFLHLYMLTMTIYEVLHLIICSTSQGSLPWSTSRGICTFQLMICKSLTSRDLLWEWGLSWAKGRMQVQWSQPTRDLWCGRATWKKGYLCVLVPRALHWWSQVVC